MVHDKSLRKNVADPVGVESATSWSSVGLTSNRAPEVGKSYEGVSINNQPIQFPMDRDGHDVHALFQYMFYTWVQNYTRIESFFNKILNVKHG